MSATLLSGEALSARETLRVVVLYDDRASRDHVLRIRDRLAEHFGSELEFACSWWKFDFLAEPAFGATAAKEAERADVVVFAVHSSTSLPAHVENWAERSVAKGRADRGLVALLGPEDTETDLGQLDSFLNNIAGRAGLDYLGASAIASVPSELARRSISHRASSRTSVMDDILRFRPADRPRWGINE